MIAGRNKLLTPVRCMKTRPDGTRCTWRGTLRKPPLEYKRAPTCPRCAKTITIIDYYRVRNEWKVKPCNCGGYTFPHFKGRGYCEHNPKLTAEDLRQRVEGGGPTDAADDDAVPF
jgi:hypothetical protein